MVTSSEATIPCLESFGAWAAPQPPGQATRPNQTVEVVASAVPAVDVFDHEVLVHPFPVRCSVSAVSPELRPVASAESFRNCDPSGSRFNLRLAVPVEVVALTAA